MPAEHGPCWGAWRQGALRPHWDRALLSSSDNEVEQQDLTQSLCLVKEVISAVDSKVASYEKKVRLNEIYTKTDSKSIMRMKSGQMFAKEDLRRKKLVRDGSVFLKSATGRLKGEARSCLTLRALQGERAGHRCPRPLPGPSSRRSPAAGVVSPQSYQKGLG